MVVATHVGNKWVIMLLCLLLAASRGWTQSPAQELPEPALQEGGLVILMRHASSPRQAPEEAIRDAANVNGERQLDEAGRTSARAMGQALSQRNIVISEVLSSPSYRAMQTARLLGFDAFRTITELGTEGMREEQAAYARWLRQQLSEAVPAGNRLMITHAPIITNVFPDAGRGMEDGEALIIDPRATGGPEVLARVRIEEWAAR